MDENNTMLQEEVQAELSLDIPLDIADLNDPGYIRTITQNELLDKVIIEEPPVIDGFLMSGISLLAGAPKVGKSFLVLQIAYHVSTGKPMWGMTVRQSDVLYLALEDTEGRLQRRSARMFGEIGSDHLHFAVTAKTISSGLLDQLAYFLRKHPNTGLFIIDTMQFSREDAQSGNLYVADTAFMKTIQEFRKQHNVNILLVHHTRKGMEGNDSFDKVNGSNGNTGGADTSILMVKEKRTDTRACLKCTGRDIQDQIIWVTRNEENLTWELESRETSLPDDPPDPLLEAVRCFLTGSGNHWEGSSTELATVLKIQMAPSALSRKLNIRASILRNDYHIQYKNVHTRDGSLLTLHMEPQESDDCDGVTAEKGETPC